MAISNKESVISAVERILDNYLEMNNHRKTLERYTILRAVYGIHGHFTLEDLSAKLINEMSFHVIVFREQRSMRLAMIITAIVIRYVQCAER